MFSDFKKRLNSVIQEGRNLSENISASYIRQTSGSPDTGNSFGSTSTRLTTGVIPSCIRLTAGCSYLEEQELIWKELHDNNELNASIATSIDEQIRTLRESSIRSLTNVSDLNHSFNCIPSLKDTLRRCGELTQVIQGDCRRVEQSLFELEDLIEVLALQEQQLNHRFEMAIYKEKKLVALDQVRQELVDRHANNVRQFEQKLRSVQQERQAVFQDAFQNDLQSYRQSGTIPKMDHVQRPVVSLEEIVLDTRDDSKELDEFLNN